MNLRELLDGVACEVVQGRPDVEVKMIHFDSRKVGEGDLFVAQRGVSADGHGYIGKAVAAGAVAVVCEEVPGELKEGVVYVKTGNSSEALGVMASNFYGNPSPPDEGGRGDRDEREDDDGDAVVRAVALAGKESGAFVNGV